MKYPRRRWTVTILTLGAVAFAAGPGCSSSRVSGGGPDATGDDGDGGGDGDASILDATGDAATIDARLIDARIIDAPVDSSTDAPTDAPTDASTCPTQPCDYHIPCGCAAPLACDIDFTDLVGSSCRAVNVPGTQTSTCGSFSECAGGYTCVMAGGGMRCERFCTDDTECDQPRGRCLIQITNQQGAPIAGATTCSSSCNPLATTNGGACPANWKCGFFTIGTQDIVDCALPGAGVHGTACTSDAMCGPGTMCSTYTVNGVPSQRCRRVCNRTAGGQECAQVAGTSCLGFGDPLTVGGTEYGICAP